MEKAPYLKIPSELHLNRRKPLLFFINVLDVMFPASLYDHIKDRTQAELPKDPDSGLPRWNPITRDEIIACVFAQIEHRALHHNEPACDYFVAIDVDQASRASVSRERRWGVSQNRFWRICSHMTGDFEYLALALSKQAREFVVPRGSWSLDESLLACQADNAPTVFIDRKPHKVGLRSFLTLH